MPSLSHPQKLGFFGKCAPPGTRRNCTSRLAPEELPGTLMLSISGPSCSAGQSLETGKSKKSSIDTLEMWIHLPRPHFQASFSFLIYLSESPRSFELLAVFPPCPASCLLLYIFTPQRYTFSSIYSFSLLPTPPYGPITAKEINKKHNSFWLLLFFVCLFLSTATYIITSKQILLLK